MNPSELSSFLRQIATKIDNSQKPSVSRVASDIKKAIAALTVQASAQTVSVTVRDALKEQIHALLPSVFTDSYDTNPNGKGYSPGLISFGLQPVGWQSEGIIGGILVKLRFNPADFASESGPEGASADFVHSKGSITASMTITGGYYNKKSGGSVAEQGVSADLGTITVALKPNETIDDLIIDDPGLMVAGFKSIIKEIGSNPPDYAQSEGYKRKQNSPTTSPLSLLKWLSQNQRSDVGQSEIDALANAMSKRQESAIGPTKQNVVDFFRKRGWSINQAALEVPRLPKLKSPVWVESYLRCLLTNINVANVPTPGN